jgi:2-methylisocitrate lyase-like PEP mutase family enzyme
MSEHAEIISNLDRDVPVIADADTGYGGPNMVARTVERYCRAGVAALHIEDQIQTKRCGHLAGKQVIDREAFARQIRAAYQTRIRLESDILIIARTDALQTHGYDEAIARLRDAIAAGADVAFLEGLTSADQCKRVCQDLSPTPVLLNMVEHGATPSFTPDEARSMGFRIIIFPFAAIFSAYEAMSVALSTLKETGKTNLETKYTPKHLFELVGLNQARKIDDEAGGTMYGAV